ncbi:YafY family protein [Actinocorallia longicatena]|uniref:YafY family protein n=1 Tax=Actinocorallia longicatena TaxID=111803 RepID=A0ABP6QFP7_9ACTN
MSHPTTRVLTMLELLQARPRLTGAELADRLEVDERTVRRYALRLADLGIPVIADRGRHGGYRLMPGYKLPPLMLTDDEASSVVLGLLAARHLGLAAEATESTLAKIGRVLPAKLRDRITALQDTLAFTAPSRAPAREGSAPDADTVLTLADAIRARRRVTLAYRSHQGAESARDLDAHGLVFHSGRWYVTGHDHKSGERRTFRVDRIAEVTLTGTGYTIPDDADPAAHVAASMAAVPWAHEVEVVLHVPPETAAGRVPKTVATLTPEGEDTLLRMRAQSLSGTALFLAGVGFPFTVRAPAALLPEVHALARRLLATA